MGIYNSDNNNNTLLSSRVQEVNIDELCTKLKVENHWSVLEPRDLFCVPLTKANIMNHVSFITYIPRPMYAAYLHDSHI